MSKMADTLKVWCYLDQIAHVAHDDVERAVLLSWELKDEGLLEVADEMTDGGFSLRLAEMEEVIGEV